MDELIPVEITNDTDGDLHEFTLIDDDGNGLVECIPVKIIDDDDDDMSEWIPVEITDAADTESNDLTLTDHTDAKIPVFMASNIYKL